MATKYDFLKVEMDIVIEEDITDYQLRGDIRVKTADGQEVSFVHGSQSLDLVRYPNIEKALGQELYDFIVTASFRVMKKLGDEIGRSVPVKRE